MGASSSPPYPYPGGTPGAEAPDPQAGAAGHFAWSNWIKQFVKNLDAQVVKISGDVMTGLLTLSGNPTADMHAATKAYVDNASNAPLGMLGLFPGAVPAGWVICDGRLHNSAELNAYLGSAYTPDLRDRFLIGASTNTPLKSTGGAASVTLTAAQSGLPGHSHGLTINSGGSSHTHSIDVPGRETGSSGGHSHGGYTGWMDRNQSHSHTATTYEGITTGDSNKWIDTADQADPDTPRDGTVKIGSTDTNHLHPISTDGAHTHWIDHPPFTSGAASDSHGHTGTVGTVAAAAATSAHENRPPYYAAVWAIKA